MLIILTLTIIICTVCICKKIDYTAEQVNKVEKELEYKPDNWTVKSLEYKLDSIDSRLKNIDLTLDGSLDDIIYYMPKNR